MAVVSRDMTKVTGGVIHQTACYFGPVKEPVLRHRRALRVACHALAFTDGCVAIPNPLDCYVHHAQAFNAYTLGLEIEGPPPATLRGQFARAADARLVADAPEMIALLSAAESELDDDSPVRIAIKAMLDRHGA